MKGRKNEQVSRKLRLAWKEGRHGGCTKEGWKRGGKTRSRLGVSRGKNNGMWKGGRVLSYDGYIVCPSGKKGVAQFREHRAIMEARLGRKLARSEIVHHINGIKTDNRLENLQLMTRKEHARHHITDKFMYHLK